MEDGSPPDGSPPDGSPPYTTVTSDISNTPAPPYLGPPLDSGVVTSQTTPVQTAAQNFNQPVSPPVHQQNSEVAAQHYYQPVDPQYPQPFYQNSGQPPITIHVQQNNQNTQAVTKAVVQRPTEAPGSMICPHCKCSIVTTIEYKVGLLTWTIVGVLCMLLIWPFCFIPFCVSSCKDVKHSCPQCNNVLHIYKRM